MIKIPQNLEAERGVLGSVLIRPAVLGEIGDTFHQDIFYEPKHKNIARGILDLFNSGSSIDIITLTEYFRNKKQIDEVGGVSYITEVASSTPSSTNANYYMNIVLDKYRRRILIENSDKIITEASDSSSDLTEVTADAIALLSEKVAPGSGGTNLKNALDSFDKRVEEYENSGGTLLGTSTGFKKLDYTLDGIQEGHLGIVSAYTSSGKTAFGLNIFWKFVSQGKKVVMFSLEMSPVQIIARLISVATGIDTKKILHNNLSHTEKEEVKKVRETIKKSDSVIYSNNNWTNIKMTLFKESMVGKTDLIIMDYLQLIKMNKPLFETMMIVSQELQYLLQKFNIPMVALSQISNESHKSTNEDFKTPKGAGDIAASADWVALLKTDEKSNDVRDMKKEDGMPINVKMFIQKNRHGQTGSILFYFFTRSGLFGEDGSFDISPYAKRIAEIESIDGSSELDAAFRE